MSRIRSGSINKNNEASARSWIRYTVMQSNRRVASIRSDGTCTLYRPSLLPYNLYLEHAAQADINTRLNNLENFYHWCASRVLTLDRAYAKEILNSLGQKQAATDKERARIAIAYHGLSFTDVFWIKGDREQVDFSDINLFEHSLSDAFVDVALRGKQLTVQNAMLIHPGDVAGDVSAMGVAPKAWIRQGNSFYLLKDGDRRLVKAELLASKIIRCFKVDQVEYSPDFYKGEEVTRSKLITSLELSIVPMEHLEIYAANHDMRCEDIALKHDPYGYYMMNIIDYLTGNTDRHWGNWGFMVDNRTNRLLKLHPLLDFNQTFRAYDNMEGARCQTSESPKSQLEAAIDAVKMIGLNQIAEVKKDWFDDDATWQMFSNRLALLMEEEKNS